MVSVKQITATVIVKLAAVRLYLTKISLGVVK